MVSKLWDEIIYPLPNFNGCPVKVADMEFHTTLYDGCKYFFVRSMRYLFQNLLV